ncbi:MULTISPECIES: DUF2753 family protein [unclassified Photobacterium]|uniref:DUF2753 family protein n=1 Tax=unclassified Photobacterium TaxID=2628852 RepID=UPI001EE14841|nr:MULTISPECIES: DUF2753 family protein [unclassified Photobacterium]MCG3863013.1 DUF2753 family protein [Photobacterium sp. Ph6]MCG3874543.1 DUF2753 family protein [Photobacterium sp. Ph5]
MDISEWERHTLMADDAKTNNNPLMSIVHYQLALSIAQEITADPTDIEQLTDLLTMKVVSCHNLANFWRQHGDPDYELKYLQLASEQVIALIPQCKQTQCHSYINSLGGCQSALISFLKRHPNPAIANQVKAINNYSSCELITSFKLH